MAEASSANYKIGDRITATSAELNGQLGTIKYVGALPGQKGTWFGVELDNSVGRHDGSFKGTRYFDGKAQHGVFLKETAFVPCEFDPSTFTSPEAEAETTAATENISPTEITQEDITQNEQETTETEDTSPAEVEAPTQEKPKEEKKTTAIPTRDNVSKTGITKPTTGVTKPSTTTTKPGIATKDTTASKTATGTTLGASTVKKTTTTATKTPVAASTTTAKPATTTTTKAATGTTATAGASTAEVKEYKQEIESLNLEIKRLNEELELKDGEIEDLNGRNGEFKAKMEDMEVSFRTERETLQKKLADLQATKADELKKLDELDSEYKKKFRDTHQQLQETLKEKKELDFQVKKLQRELEASQNSEAMVENLILEKDTLAERAEIAELELEEFRNKVKGLEEEKELLQLEMEEALLAQGGTDAGELRLENMRIKQALEKLHSKYESEKRESEAKISDLSGRVESVPKIEEKEKLIKQLNGEIKEKDGIIEDLKYRIDDAQEAVTMVETLTEDLLQKDDEIIELRREIMHIKKDFETDEQLIEEQEDYLKELEKDVMNKDYEISTLKNKIEEQVTAQVESEKVLQKFKEKLKSVNEELELMKLKMSGGDEKRLFDKIDELSHKQIELVNQIRENRKRQLAAQLERIKAINDTLKYSVLISVLPKNLKDKMHGESLNKFVQIVSLKDKINLLVREIKGKYYRDEYHANENIEFLTWLKDLLLDLADVILYCDILELKFYSFDHEDEIENYVLFSKSNIFNQLLAINSIVDQLFNNIREDTLSVKYNLDTLRLVIGKLNTSCQEYEEQFASIPVKLKKSIDQSIAQAYEIYAYGNNKHLKLPKTEKVISRLEEFNHKLHKNLILDENVDDKHESNFETMIGLKYSLESFAAKIKESELVTPEELDDLESGLEHECSRLTGYQVQTEDEHQALTHRGPWNQINNSLRNEIEQVSETAISFEKATSQLKEQIRANLQQQNEMKDLNNIKEALEKRVADLQLKSEKATQLEMEKKRFLEREVHFKEATEKIRHTLDNAEKKVKQLEEENAKLRDKAGPAGSSQSSKVTGKGQPSVTTQSRSSLSDLNEKLIVGGVAQSDVEEYLNIISKLGEENISAKADTFKRRVKDLNTTMPAFARCMERRNVAKQQGSSASDEDKTKLGQIVNRVNEISKRTKLEICQSSVVSLDEFSGKSKFEKQDVIDQYLKNKSETSSKLKYEVLSLSNQIVNFTNKIQEQSKFKLFFEPSVIDLLQNRTGTVQSLGKLEILGAQGSSGAAQARTDEIVLNKAQLREFRQLVL